MSVLKGINKDLMNEIILSKRNSQSVSLNFVFIQIFTIAFMDEECHCESTMDYQLSLGTTIYYSRTYVLLSSSSNYVAGSAALLCVAI